VRIALLANAVSIIVAHNHPSGSMVPSYEDIDCTRRLVAAAALLDVEVLDHVIVGYEPNTFCSMKTNYREVFNVRASIA
jgi:DNA repair protein RadC